MRPRSSVRVALQAARYARVKDTAGYAEEQKQLRAQCTDALVGLGYTRERAARAVQDYADAAYDTMLGPDWDGFLELVSRVGLVRPGPVTGWAAELQARRSR